MDRIFNRPVESTSPALEDGGAAVEADIDAGQNSVSSPENLQSVPAEGGGLFDLSLPFGTENPADLQRGGAVPAAGAGNTPPAAPPVTPMRERVLYLLTVDGSGMVFLKPVKRQLPNTASPLTESITSLLAGPDGAESAAGLTSLIPAGVKLINARIQGNTAFLNFSENFLFNNYDAEGYYAQLRQIVWTATEFPNIRNVQFLIENRKVEYLGLTIRIDKPLGRESL